MKNSLNRNLYLFAGEDDALIKERMEIIFKKYNLHINDPNVEIISDDTGTSEIITNMITPPLFGDHKLIWIKNIKKFKKNKKEDNGFLRILKEELPGQNIIVFTCLPADMKSESLSEIKKISNFEEIKVSDDWYYQKANEMLKKSEKKIDKNALDLFFSLTSENAENFKNELEKLLSYVGPEKKIIEKNDVMSIASSKIDEPFFKLGDEILSQNPGSYAKSLKKLLFQGENPNGLIINLLNNFRFLMQAAFLIEEGFIKKNTVPTKYSEGWIKKCITEMPRNVLESLPRLGNIFSQHPYRTYLFILKGKEFTLKALKDLFLKTCHAYWEIVNSRSPEIIMGKIVF